MNVKVLLTALFYFNAFMVVAQMDSSILRVNRLTHENVIESSDERKVTVVSASRSAKKVEDLPVTIQVITGEEILLRGYVTLVDVLKSLPSMRVSQPGSAENGEMFMMRGLIGNQYTKILVDNVPIKPSVATGLPIEAQLPIRQAERIEIIYGPSGAIYGADAAIGVINIITRKPASRVFANADVFVGDNNYRYTNFHVGGKAGRNQNILEYSFFGSFMDMRSMNIFNDSTVYHPMSYVEQQEGSLSFTHPETGEILNIAPTKINQEIVDEYQIPWDELFKGMDNYEGTVTMPEISEIPAQSNMFGVNLKYKKWEISFLNMYRKTHSSIGRSPFLYKYNSSDYFLADYNSKLYVNYNTTIGNINFNTSFQSSLYRLDENSSFGVNFIPNIVRAYQFASSIEGYFEQLITYNYKFIEVVGGLSSRFSFDMPMTNFKSNPYSVDFEIEPSTIITIDTVNYDKFGENLHAFINASAFIQTYFNLHKFKVVGGLRYDYNTLFEENITTPRLALLYSLNKNHSFHLSTGTAYKPPTGNQMFQSLAFPYVNQFNGDSGIYYVAIPNPQLLPEEFKSHEFGYRGNVFENRLLIDFALYYNRIENLILTQYTHANRYYSNAIEISQFDLARMYVNTREAVTEFYGIDLAVTFKDIYKPMNLDVQMSGTYTYGSERLDSGESIKYLRGIPNYMFKINISGRYRKAYLNIENTLMSSWRRSYLPRKDYYSKSDYSKINGYFVTDFTFGFRFHKNLNGFIRVINLFNAKYGGIDATSMDADLRYNPQLGTATKIGLSFILN